MSRFFMIIGQASCIAYLISGKEKHSGEKLTILFISKKNLSPYISNLIFSKESKIVKKFNVNIWNYKKKINQIVSDTDAVFIKCDRFYSNFFEKKGFIVIPEWINMTLDISEPWDSFYKKLSKSAKEDIRKIKKLGYTYEITRDIDKLKMFYYKMYLPYISWKYRESEIQANFYTIQHIFEQAGELLLTKLDDEYIFGGLFLRKKDKIITSFAGIMEGKFEFVQQGAIAASYYFLIQYSKERDVKSINFGSSRPFFNDGIFMYKRKWGAKIDKAGNLSADIYSLKTFNKNNAIKSFLTNNPFVHTEKKSN